MHGQQDAINGRGVNLHWSHDILISRCIDDALHPQFSILLHMYTILSINTSSQIYELNL